jgi:hypothetical protein
MPNFRRTSPFDWTRRLFTALALNLLLIGSFSVFAQENINNVNANNTNQNASQNSNANLSNNTNGNGNQRTGTPTPTPDAVVETRRNQLVNTYWYYALISLIFAAVLLPFSYSIYRAVRYSKSTYGPLGLPEGSLRALLAFTLVVFLGLYILASVLSLSDFRPPDFLLGIVATVIGFYFGSRTGEEKAGGTAARTGTVEGTVTNAGGAPAVGATVEVTQTDGTKQTGKADAQGKYKIEKVPAGAHDVQASLTGQTPSDKTKVTVKVGETQTVNLTLK